MTVRILVGDCRDVLKTLPDASVQMCVTSPPYFGLRDYGVDGQIGLERSMHDFIAEMVAVFREVRRVLRDDGTLWLNLGDSYAGSWGAQSRGGPPSEKSTLAGNGHIGGGPKLSALSAVQVAAAPKRTQTGTIRDAGIKPKDLMLIPERVALALQADGWYVRSRIIWHKLSAMPESVTDRPTKAHEHIWLLSKSERYFYDKEAASEPVTQDERRPTFRGGAYCNNSTFDNSEGGQSTVTGNVRVKVPSGWDTKPGAHGTIHREGRTQEAEYNMIGVGHNERPRKGAPNVKRSGNKERKPASARGVPVDTDGRSAGAVAGSVPWEGTTRNWRDVWPIGPEPFKDVHFACVDDQTEALTPTGWKRHESLVDGELIAAYDVDSDALVWQPATFHRYPFDGDLVAIEKRDSSQRLTPNHRCLVRTRNNGPKVVLAENLRHGMSIPTTATLSVAECAGPGVTLAALLGWYVTEGERKRHNIVRINQSRSANPEKVKEIRSLLETIGAVFTEGERTREWRGRPSVEVTFNINGEIARRIYDLSPEKRVAWEWVNWPIAEVAAFLNAVIDGDGHRRRDGRRCVVQKDREFLDVLQAMALRLGWRGHISARQEGGFTLYLTEGRWLTLRGTNGVHRGAIGRESYKGYVWCPSVASTFWLARRSGKPFITGNTFPTEIPRRAILAGSRPGDTILDPFGGAGTTGLVADRLQRDAVLIELNPAYADMARRRIHADNPLFSAVEAT